MADDSPTAPTRALARRDLLVKGGMAAAATAAATTGVVVAGAGPAAAAPLSPVLLPVGPIRIFDTRSTVGRLFSGDILTLTTDTPIPEDLAYMLNVTITETVGSGWVSVYPGDVPWPGTSTLNWSQSGQTIANSAFTGIGSGTDVIAIRVGGGGSTQVVIDLTGVLTVIDLGAPTALSASSLAAGPDRTLHAKG